MSTAVLGQGTRPVGRGRSGARSTLTGGAGLGLGIALTWFSILVLIPIAAIVVAAGGAGLGLGIALTWFSILVLIPIAAIVVAAGGEGWHGYVDTLTNPQTWAAIKLTVGQSLLVTGINVVMGTAIAWVLVRDRFWGK